MFGLPSGEVVRYIFLIIQSNKVRLTDYRFSFIGWTLQPRVMLCFAESGYICIIATVRAVLVVFEEQIFL